MRFWDSSAIVPLIIAEKLSAFALALLKQDEEIAVWTLSRIECCSALNRKYRERKLDTKFLALANARLLELEISWMEVIQLELVKRRAERLLSVHPLRAADALQLGAALVAFNERPESNEFVTFDSGLAEIARKEGFTVPLP